MKKIIFFLFLAFFGSFNLHAQCSPDTEPPTADLHLSYTVNFGVVGDEIELWASDFNINSSDNCSSDLIFSFSSDITDLSQTFSCANLGSNPLEIWVTDEAGNQASTDVELIVSGTSNPPLICDDFTTVNVPSGGAATLFPENILEGPAFCLDEAWSLQLDFSPSVGPSPSIVFDETDAGLHTIQVSLFDDDGNQGNSCWGTVEVLSCIANTTPVAVCDAEVFATVFVGETLTLTAEGFDDGSYDACTPQNDLIFEIENGIPPSATNPGTTVLTFDENDQGNHDIVMWVGDTEGNWNQCVVDLEIHVIDCVNDTVAPYSFCHELEVVIPTGATEVEVWATDFNLGSFDDCTSTFDLELFIENSSVPSSSPPATTSLTLSEGAEDIILWVVDEAGNASPCATTVAVDNCTPTTVMVCNNFVQVSVGAPDVITTIEPAFILEGGDLCLAPGNYLAMQLNPPSTPQPNLEFTFYDGGDYTVSVGLYDSDDNLVNSCWATLQVSAFRALWGDVFLDTIVDCSLDNEPLLAGQPVSAISLVTGEIYTTVSDSFGRYSFAVEPVDSILDLNLSLGYNYGITCPTTHLIEFDGQSVHIQDIPVQLNGTCPLMTVDVATNLLRRCFDNTYYVNYCNLSANAIEEVSIELTLDPFMDLMSSTLPGTETSPDIWTFDIGTLQPGECGNFNVVVNLSCEAELGATHCMEALILPDTICPSGGTFTGANIEVNGFCENDTIFMSITNTGTAAMAVPLDYIVVEDVIMLQGGDFELNPGDTMPLTPIFADGSTYRLEAEQEPNHPYGGVAAIAIEGCGEAFTPGLVNLFPLSTPNPFFSIECLENIGAYDPNDKQAFPRGYGDEHFIEKNTDIEYKIRFQNTGTDTAFNVVVLDTLSSYLDAATVRPGASSHDYNFEVMENKIVRFTFPNIMLPDSNVNVALSQGFLKFRVSQIPDLANDIVIENTAAIYFDFNEPVITNTVFHTIGEHFIEVVSSTEERPNGLGDLTVYPNPAFGPVNFELPADAPDGAVFQLHDHLGRLVEMEQFTGGKYRFERGGLTPGIYFYSVDLEGLGRYAGKVILK